MVVALATGCAGLLGAPRHAFAYTIETQITQGCHESISADALRSVRATSGLGDPLPYTDPEDGPLVDDLPFTIPDDLRDIGGAALLLGVRDNDVKDLRATSLAELAAITADSAAQREHCLRAADEREPDGSQRAVADCRAFIKEKLLAALDGLGADGKPDAGIRDTLTVSLALTGKVDVRVPAFYLRAGQAIHALQDSFTHTFRDAADPHRVSVVLDWIDYAENSLDEAKEGPPHMSQLDRCDDSDDLRTTRHHLAIEASAAALRIALDPALSKDAKASAFDQMLDTYLSYDGTGGCAMSNGWCNAAENQYRPTGCGCSATSTETSTAPAIVALAAIAALAARRRQRRTTRAAAVIVAAAAAAAPGVARADDTPPPKPALLQPVAALKGESRAGTPGREDPAGSLFGHAAVAASYDHAALAFTLGAKYQLSRLWMVGADVEWNPWIPVDPLGVRLGAGNAYLSIVRRYQMVVEQVNFRTTAALGASTLLIDLPGANKWGIGPLAGISFIGVEFKMAPGFFLTVDPTYLMFTVPHVTGVPLVYPQYRFQVALEFGG